MSDTTQLVMAGTRTVVPRLLKRLVQMALAVALTAGLFFVVIAGNGYLTGRTTFQAGFQAWLAFIRRPDILTTMVATAVVTVLMVYWQREKERRSGGSSRPGI